MSNFLTITLPLSMTWSAKYDLLCILTTFTNFEMVFTISNHLKYTNFEKASKISKPWLSSTLFLWESVFPLKSKFHDAQIKFFLHISHSFQDIYNQFSWTELLTVLVGNSWVYAVWRSVNGAEQLVGSLLPNILPPHPSPIHPHFSMLHA